jgi:hypothetical protein
MRVEKVARPVAILRGLRLHSAANFYWQFLSLPRTKVNCRAPFLEFKFEN